MSTSKAVQPIWLLMITSAIQGFLRPLLSELSNFYPEDPQTLGDILRGSLQIHNEEPQKVPYETLSYVWGNLKLTHKIQLSDDKALPITANLHAALTSLAAQNWP
jgi:Heterokaryon incompatibility protein (HET)